MLRVSNLSKSYGKEGVKAVDDISFEVKRGEVFGFLGPNGAGKTTTIKMMVGLLKPDSGSVTIDEIDISESPIEAKSKMAFVPDSPDVYKRLSGIEYVNFIADMYEVPTELRKERTEYLANLFELTEAMGDPIISYSHGMSQKIVLIGALISEPDVLVLDEPMVGLDPKSTFNLKNVMRDMCDRGKSVFFSTHVLDVAENFCDRIGIIKKGKIIALGSVEELKNRSGKEESLEKTFLEITENE